MSFPETVALTSNHIKVEELRLFIIKSNRIVNNVYLILLASDAVTLSVPWVRLYTVKYIVRLFE